MSQIRVWAQYGDWPPVGEVVILLGNCSTRLTPENAEFIGTAMIAFAAAARGMTEMVETNQEMLPGIWITDGGGHC